MFVCVHHVSTSRAHQSAATIAAQFTWAPIEQWVLITACATEYAARAVARNWTPLGMAEGLGGVGPCRFERPTWAHDHPKRPTARGRPQLTSRQESSTIPENRCIRTLFGANCRTSW